MRKFLPVVIVFVVVYAWQQLDRPALEQGSGSYAPAPQTDSLWSAGQQVSGSGRVVRILSDDNEGSRHQRFILELPSGRTVLIAHNIDLAPRISSLQTGDTVAFYGIAGAGGLTALPDLYLENPGTRNHEPCNEPRRCTPQ